MVRSKIVLSTISHSFYIVTNISVDWVLIGYTMTFGRNIAGFIKLLCLVLRDARLLGGSGP